MPSNISSSDGLWNIRELSARKNRRAKSAPMKERLSNFSSDADDNSTAGGSSLENTLEKTTKVQEVPPSPGTESPTSNAISGKKTLFGKIRKVPMGGASNTLDVFHFEGEGLQFRGKLIGIKDVAGARGDEMCQQAMQELKTSLKQTKEHKTKIGVGVALSGLKIKDEKGTSVMHQHPIPKISYIWRDPSDQRAFGYCYGTPDSGHRFFAIKVEKSADPLVAAIHRLFQVAFRMKQHELEMAKKGQDDTSSNEGGDSKKENAEGSTMPDHSKHHKVDEANLLDLETELEVLSHAFSQGIDQTSVASGQNGWADFNNDSSSTSSSSDPFGRGSTPQSIRTITPDPFDTVGSAGAFQVPSHPQPVSSLSQPSFAPQTPIHQQQPLGWGIQSNAMNIVQNDPFVTQSSATSSFNNTQFGSAQSTPASMGFFDISAASSFNNSNGIFGGASTNNGSPFGSTPNSAMGLTEQFVSVFDTPIAQPAPLPAPPAKKVSVASNDGFELFQDLQTIGAPRAEKTSKKSFPMPVQPKLGDLRGDVPSVVVPSPSTVDPFLVTMTGTSPPFTGLSNGFEANMMASGNPSIPTRSISSANGTNFSPPQVPPRPSPPQSSNFPSLAPPPAPRRQGTSMLNQGAMFDGMSINGTANANPFGTHTSLHASNSLPVFSNQPNLFVSSVSPPAYPPTAQMTHFNSGVFSMKQQSQLINDPFADTFFK